ncbi:MAG: HD domain-containing protein [Caldilineaceae bacterium]
MAAHSFATALLALSLAETINLDPAAESLAGPLDAARAVRLALLHDLAESLVTDLPKRSAELLGTAAKHAAEETAMATVLAGLPHADADCALGRVRRRGYARGPRGQGCGQAGDGPSGPALRSDRRADAGRVLGRPSLALRDERAAL